MRGWKKIFHANENQKKAGVAILISDKTDLNIKDIIRDKEGHYIMIKESIQEEDITTVYTHTHPPQQRITSIHKATANNLKRRN